MRLAIFGGTGKIGAPLLTQALAAGHSVNVYARRPERLAGAAGAKVFSGALADPDVVEAVIRDTDAVLLTLAAGNQTLRTFSATALPFMREHGPKRIVSLVGAAVRLPGDPETFTLKLMTGMMRLIPNGLLADAETHVRDLAASGLEWTLVRSANFVDRPPSGRLRAEAGFAMPISAQVSRADLAAFMLDIAVNRRFIGQAPMVCNAS